MRLIFKPVFLWIVRCMALCAGVVWANQAHAVPILQIKNAQGEAWIERNGNRLIASPSLALQIGDILHTGAAARVQLQFGRHGEFNLSQWADLEVVQMPFASWATDLNSEFRLLGGSIRLNWLQSSLNVNWPLAIQLGTRTAQLSSGEYFFTLPAAGTVSAQQLFTACVAYGEMRVRAPDSTTQIVRSVNCGELEPNGTWHLRKHSDDSVVKWRDSLREGRTLMTEALDDKPVPGDLENFENQQILSPTSRLSPAMQFRFYQQPNAPEAVMLTTAQPDMMPLPTRNIKLVMALATPPQAEPPLRDLPAEVVQVADQSSDQALWAKASLNPDIQNAAWVLNVLSLTNEKEARIAAEHLQATGYPSQIRSMQIDGTTWYRVQITGYADAAQARVAAQSLRQTVGIQNAWALRE